MYICRQIPLYIYMATEDMTKIIGRKNERQQLAEAYEKEESLFVVVYGRRRVGKTFLVRETFEDKMDFYATGVNQGGKDVQIMYFYHALCKYSDKPLALPKSWLEAFDMLIHILESVDSKKKVVFLDELSWMNGQDGTFLTALEWFWNSWASGRKDILLICCSSATSWVVNKVFNNHGGLYGRVNRRIHLHPFNLHECEEFYHARGIAMNYYDQVMSYMIFGGVPYYLSMFDSGKSLTQNIDCLLFDKDGQLHHEYENLYQAMFRNADNHLLIVSAIASKNKGLTRKEILESTGLANAGSTTRVLDELEQSDFIRRYTAFGQKKRDELYQLTDAYTLFYYHFLKDGRNNDNMFWQHHLGTSKINAWAGYAFEQVCLAHIEQIKIAMGINGMAVSSSGWVSKSKETKAQIDLVLDRADNIVNICEIKFSTRPYQIDKKYADTLQNRQWIFEQETRPRKSCQQVMITTYGLVKNQYSGIIQRDLTMEDLFRP